MGRAADGSVVTVGHFVAGKQFQIIYSRALLDGVI